MSEIIQSSLASIVDVKKGIDDLIYALAKAIENGEFAKALEKQFELRKYDDEDKKKVLEEIEKCPFVIEFVSGFMDRVESDDVKRRRRKRQQSYESLDEDESNDDFAKELVKKIADNLEDHNFFDRLAIEIVKEAEGAGFTKQELIKEIEASGDEDFSFTKQKFLKDMEHLVLYLLEAGCYTKQELLKDVEGGNFWNEFIREFVKKLDMRRRRRKNRKRKIQYGYDAKGYDPENGFRRDGMKEENERKDQDQLCSHAFKKDDVDFAKELVKEIENDIKKQEDFAKELVKNTKDDFLAASRKERDERWRNGMKEEEMTQATTYTDNRKLNDIVWREGILDEAKRCVCGKRQQDYGTPEDNFATIADFWNTYLGGRLSANNPINSHDVGVMMALLKIARIKSGGTAAGSMDNYIDLAGYAACAGEMYAFYKD